jgi:hypothetical protein
MAKEWPMAIQEKMKFFVETVRLLEELASSLVATREEVVDADDVVRDGVVGVVLGEEVAEVVECREVLGLEETGCVDGEVLELERVFGEDSGMRGEQYSLLNLCADCTSYFMKEFLALMQRISMLSLRTRVSKMLSPTVSLHPTSILHHCSTSPRPRCPSSLLALLPSLLRVPLPSPQYSRCPCSDCSRSCGPGREAREEGRPAGTARVSDEGFWGVVWREGSRLRVFLFSSSAESRM